MTISLFPRGLQRRHFKIYRRCRISIVVVYRKIHWRHFSTLYCISCWITLGWSGSIGRGHRGGRIWRFCPNTFARSVGRELGFDRAYERTLCRGKLDFEGLGDSGFLLTHVLRTYVSPFLSKSIFPAGPSIQPPVLVKTTVAPASHN